MKVNVFFISSDSDYVIGSDKYPKLSQKIQK